MIGLEAPERIADHRPEVGPPSWECIHIRWDGRGERSCKILKDGNLARRYVAVALRGNLSTQEDALPGVQSRLDNLAVANRSLQQMVN